MARKKSGMPKVKYTNKKGLGDDEHKISQRPSVSPRKREKVVAPRAVKKIINNTGPQASCQQMAALIDTCAEVRGSLDDWLDQNSTILQLINDVSGQSYLSLSDTSDSDYTGKANFIPRVTGSTLTLTNIDNVLATSTIISDLQNAVQDPFDCADLLNDPCRRNIEDIVGAMAIGGVQSGIEVTYDSGNRVLNFIIDQCCSGGDGGGGTGLDCTTVMACSGIVDLSNRIQTNENDIDSLETRVDALETSTQGLISVEEEGVEIEATLTSLNFVGDSVTATTDGSGNVTITIPTTALNCTEVINCVEAAPSLTLNDIVFDPGSTIDRTNTTQTGTTTFDNGYNATYDGSTINNNGTTENNTGVTENYDSTSVTNNNGNTTNNTGTTENNDNVTENYTNGSEINHTGTTTNNTDTTENNTNVTENYDADSEINYTGTDINHDGTTTNYTNNSEINHEGTTENYDGDSVTNHEGDTYLSNVTVENISYQESYVAGEPLTNRQPLRLGKLSLGEDPARVYGANSATADESEFIGFANRAANTGEELAALQGPRVSGMEAVYGPLTDAQIYFLTDAGGISTTPGTINVRVGDADGTDTLIGLNQTFIDTTIFLRGVTGQGTMNGTSLVINNTDITEDAVPVVGVKGTPAGNISAVAGNGTLTLTSTATETNLVVNYRVIL